MLKEKPIGCDYLQRKIVWIQNCPFCGFAAKLSLIAAPSAELVNKYALKKVAMGYYCESCCAPIPIVWDVASSNDSNIMVTNASSVLRIIEPFDYGHVPDSVKKDITEALHCLSVNAYNGFAALCRRTIQTACDALGADSSTKVETQIKELKELVGLDDETYEAVRQVMLCGHDGVHPQLPEVDKDRADLLLQLLKDIIFQLFTRLGRIKEAAQARQTAIEQK